MSCTASIIFFKASCLLIRFPSNSTVSTSLASEDVLGVWGDSGAEVEGSSEVITADDVRGDVGLHGCICERFQEAGKG